MRTLLLAALLGALALPLASAGTVPPSPLCDAVGGPACWDPYVEAHPEALPGCLSNTGLPACITVTCTLSLPPTRCGNGLVAFGFG
jgi:hypothetical protein